MSCSALGYDAIEVVVHPQSIVHSMIETSDGATLAQLSLPGHAPADRLRPGLPRSARHARSVPSIGPGWDRSSSSRRTGSHFPASTWPIGPAGRAVLAPAWLNGANEVAVAAFLAGEIRWVDIPEVIAAALDECDGRVPGTVADVLDADRSGRDLARR